MLNNKYKALSISFCITSLIAISSCSLQQQTPQTELSASSNVDEVQTMLEALEPPTAGIARKIDSEASPQSQQAPKTQLATEVANLNFATAVEPDNLALQEYQSWCISQREADQPTLPTTIAREIAINPFLRSSEPTVTQGVAKHFAMPLADPVAVFRHTRLWKDQF